MDASYALMVRTYAGIPGQNLLQAVDLANEAFGLEVEKQIPVEVENEQALEQFSAMMRGVK